MPAADRLDDALALLRANGGRVASPRRAILQALMASRSHPTVEELTVAVQAHQSDVAESTVYRFMDDLERLGVVDHVRLGQGPAVYYFADDTHHHLICVSCSRIIEVPDRIFATLRRRLRNDFAFELRPRHLAVTGHCQRCTASDLVPAD